MDTPALIAFLAVATALIVLPGPDWAFVVAQGSGRDAVLPAVAGLTSGYVVITTLVALGLGRLVAEVPVALVLLSVVGGGYLVAVGIAALRSDQDLHLASGSSDRRGAALWWRGLGVSALNPKSLLFFVAFLPQFARASVPGASGLGAAARTTSSWSGVL